MTLSGTGANDTIIDGGGQDRVVKILTGTVQISGVTIRGGHSFEPGFVSKGGAGIYNRGVLTVIATIIGHNQVFGFDVAGGGGIYNGGQRRRTPCRQEQGNGKQQAENHCRNPLCGIGRGGRT